MLRMDREYIAVIRKEEGADYGAYFPDFLGCVTAARTLEGLKNMAVEVLQLHIDGMLEDGEELPQASSLDDIKNANQDAEIFFFISAKVPTKAKRINITIDEKLLRKLDRYLEKHGDNRSHFFSQSIRERVS